MKSNSLVGRKVAVFDAEIKKRIEDCSNGWNSHGEMGVSVLVIFDYSKMRYRVFDDHNYLEALTILSTYELTVGFNTVGFDWKLLKATWPDFWPIKCAGNLSGGEIKPDGCTSRNFDILREIWLSLDLDPDRFDPRTHGGYKLDDVAWDTIKMRKVANGALAPIMFQKGSIAELTDYCIEDVRIERTLFEFIVNHQYVVRDGGVIEIPFSIENGEFVF